MHKPEITAISSIQPAVKFLNFIKKTTLTSFRDLHQLLSWGSKGNPVNHLFLFKKKKKIKRMCLHKDQKYIEHYLIGKSHMKQI